MISLSELYVRNHRQQQYLIVGGIMLALVASLAPRSERALFVTGNRATPKAFAAIAPPAAFNGLFDETARGTPPPLYRLNAPRRGPGGRGTPPSDFAPVDAAGVAPGGLATVSEPDPVQLASLDPSALGTSGFGPAGRGITGAPLAGAGPATFGPGATAAGPAGPTTPVGDGGTTPGDGGTTPGDGGTTPNTGGTTPGDGGATPSDGGTTIPVTPVGAVPEPATWAMMIVGFFGMGMLLRRRREAISTRGFSSARPGRL